MNIALITNNYTPYSGGVVSSITAQVTALQENGHLVRIITLDFLGTEHDDPDHVVRIQTPIKFTYRGNHYAIPWFMRLQLRKAIKLMNADIVHVHHPFLLGARARDVVRKLRLPIVFTYHTLYEEYNHHVPLPPLAAKALIRRLVRKFCCTVDGIIAPGPSISRYLQKQNIKTCVRCIPSPVKSGFENIPLTVRKVNAQDPVKLLSVVRFTPEKNVPFLLDVCALLDKRYELTLVGYGIEYENLRAYAYEQLQLSPRQVRFVLKPSNEQLINFYRVADLFLFSSHTDTQGLVLVEAMACSTPVIAINGPGQSDIIRHNENGLLVSTAQEMAQAVQHTTAHEGRFTTMQKGAWRTAQHYLPEQFQGQLLDMYRQLISAS